MRKLISSLQVIAEKSFVVFLCFLLLGAAPETQAVANRPKVLILGIDGMDPVLLQKYMDAGKMKNFKSLVQNGGDFKRLKTSYPPQSPVAWSNVATGTNPGQHGIFDFIHRHALTMEPYLSVTKTEAPEKMYKVGKWQVPLEKGVITNLRQGTPFWASLSTANVHSTIGQMPANYPPTCACQKGFYKGLSGMGTPDLLGTQGSFSFYTSEEMKLVPTLGGGEIYPVALHSEGRKAELELVGPEHPYKNPEAFEKEARRLKIPFVVWIDQDHKSAKIEIQGKELVLHQGDFSDWVQVYFDVIPWVQKISAEVRFMLKETDPHFKLYVSPINLDPLDAALPISEPREYSQDLARAVGPFYTQNMPPDTKALEHKVFSDDDFLTQMQIVFKEEKARLFHELDHFSEGVLFHYFGVLDQTSHVFWRAIDSDHPLSSRKLRKKYGKVIPDLYQEMDEVLGQVLARIDSKTVLIVMSDHGFTSFRRGVNLNTVFLNHGLIKLKDPKKQGESEMFQNVNWEKTYVYNLGINAVYLNLRGREREGALSRKDYDKMRDQVIKLLMELVDPKTGKRVIHEVAKREAIYHGPHVEDAPDLVVSYEPGYRASWDTILGKIPKEEIVDNLSPWSGDHAVYYDFVPGILISNRKINLEDPALIDIAPTLLKLLGVSASDDVEGRALIE